MVYYIISELKLAFKRKLCRNYFICIIIACLLANLAITVFRDLLYGINDGTYAYNLIMFAKGFFWIPYYSCIFLADIVFGDTYPNPRIRNRSNIRLKRMGMYFGKLIAEWLLLLIFTVVTAVLFLVITSVFQIHDGTINSEVVTDFLMNVGYAFPLLMAGVSISNMFLFLFDKKRLSYIWFVICVVVIPRIIMLLSTDRFGLVFFHGVREMLLTPQFNSLQFYATLDIPKIIISSVIYIVISSIIGCTRFLKKKF